MNWVDNWLNIIQHCLLPPTCILCGNAGMADLDLCAVCHRLLPRNSHCCGRCGLALPDRADTSVLCGRCLTKPPAYEHTVAPFLHHAGLRHMVASLKFSADFKNARLLALLVAEHLQNQPKPDLIVPVPLHGSRYRQRGFNQSIEIAKTLE
ncbi:ComF family protein [Methylosoma difficile]